jgi:acyl-CoA thioesterase I
MVSALPAVADDRVIAVLGDSLVAGYGLPAEDGLVPQTQAWLDAQGVAVTLVNAGVSGDTTAGGLARLDWTLTPEVDALVVALGGNDVLRGIDPGTSRANLDAILGAVTSRGLPVLLVGAPAPGNFGAEYKAEFEAIYPELAAEYQVPVFKGFLPSLVDGEITQEALAKWFQADAIHPNKEGVAIIVESFGPAVAEFAAGFDAE